MAAMQAEFRSKTPLTNDQIAKYAPSVLAGEKHASRGERYGFIPTMAVLDGMRAQGFEPFAVAQTRVRDADKREFTKHLVRLRHPDSFALAKVGDEVPEIVLINSHDGTSAYQVMAGFFRLVCTNGLIVGDMSHDVRVRHSGNVVDNVIEGSFRVVEEIQGIASHIDAYKGINLTRPEQLLLADAALEVRWGDREQKPVAAEALLKPRRWEDEKPDLWTTFNAIQENMLKGGVAAHTANGRRTHTRAVQGVNENVKLNRALWTLAEKMAELKA